MDLEGPFIKNENKNLWFQMKFYCLNTFNNRSPTLVEGSNHHVKDIQKNTKSALGESLCCRMFSSSPWGGSIWSTTKEVCNSLQPSQGEYRRNIPSLKTRKGEYGPRGDEYAPFSNVPLTTVFQRLPHTDAALWFGVGALSRFAQSHHCFTLPTNVDIPVIFLPELSQLHIPWCTNKVSHCT